MSLQTRLAALITAVGTDIKDIQESLDSRVFAQTSAPSSPEVGTIWIDTDEPAPAYYGPPIVSSLPSSPVDGQEIIYRFAQTVVPVDAKVLLWHLRWDASDAAWLPVGRQEPIFALQPSQETGASSAINTWNGVSANDPTFTTPRTGEYDIEWGVSSLYASSGVANWYIAVYYVGSEQTVNGVAPTTDICTVSSAGSYGPGHATKKMTLAATNQLKMRYYVAGGSTHQITRGGAWIKVYPRRITA